MFGITILVTEGLLERMIFELKSKRIQKIQLCVYLREKKRYIYTYIGKELISLKKKKKRHNLA